MDEPPSRVPDHVPFRLHAGISQHASTFALCLPQIIEASRGLDKRRGDQESEGIHARVRGFVGHSVPQNGLSQDTVHSVCRNNQVRRVHRAIGQGDRPSFRIRVHDPGREPELDASAQEHQLIVQVDTMDGVDWSAKSFSRIRQVGTVECVE